MKFGFLIYIIFFISFLSCEKDLNPITSEDALANILPLSIGNTWSYKFTVYDSQLTVISISYLEPSICCDTLVDGHYYYRYNNDSDVWYFNNSLGLWTIRESALGAFSTPTLRYKYPCRVGDSFDIFEVLSIDTTISVPAGKYNCILYQQNFPPISTYIEYFLSPGIGTIKSNTFMQNSKNEYYKFMSYELQDYNIN